MMQNEGNPAEPVEDIPVVDLDDVRSDKGDLLDDAVEKSFDALEAEYKERAALGKTRRKSIRKVISLFVKMNTLVIGLVLLMLVADWFTLWLFDKAKLSDRIVDQTVLMALIGATVVQLGTIMLTMSKYLFPSNDES